MFGLVSVSVLAGISIFSLWYLYCVRAARSKATQVLGWIEGALAGHGHVAGIRWHAPSKFQVPVRLRSNVFREASLMVQMFPRELPLQWLMGRIRGQQETVTFEANLDLPPGFNLELHNYRLFARTRKNLEPEGPDWHFEQTTPFVLTTRADWQKEITSVIKSLLTSEDRKFLNVSFRRTAPHFIATLPLETITPSTPERAQMFNALRELATGASAPQV